VLSSSATCLRPAFPLEGLMMLLLLLLLLLLPGWSWLETTALLRLVGNDAASYSMAFVKMPSSCVGGWVGWV